MVNGKVWSFGRMGESRANSVGTDDRNAIRLTVSRVNNSLKNAKKNQRERKKK